MALIPLRIVRTKHGARLAKIVLVGQAGPNKKHEIEETKPDLNL